MRYKQITQNEALTIIHNNLRWHLDRYSAARSVLVLDPIPDGYKSIYEHDGTSYMAFFAAQDITPPDKYKPGEMLPVPIFPYKYISTIDGYPTEHKATRHYHSLRKQITDKENENLIDILDRACLHSDHIIKVEKYNMVEMIKQAKIKLEQCDKEHDIIVTHILVNKNDFIKTVENPDTFKNIDPPTVRDLSDYPIGGYSYGTTIRYFDCIPEGTMYALADGEFVGVFSLMCATEKLIFINPNTVEISFDAGCAIFCPTHVCKVSI